MAGAALWTAGTAIEKGSGIMRRWARAFHASSHCTFGRADAIGIGARGKFFAPRREICNWKEIETGGRMHFFLDFISEAPYI